MSVPKQRQTSGRGKRRRSHDNIQKSPAIKCSNCHKSIKSHQACGFCGYYNGKPTVKIKNRVKINKDKK